MTTQAITAETRVPVGDPAKVLRALGEPGSSSAGEVCTAAARPVGELTVRVERISGGRDGPSAG